MKTKMFGITKLVYYALGLPPYELKSTFQNATGYELEEVLLKKI
jgi:hypothetical protein